jgi:phosphoribosylanthranilate isomerase
MLVQIYEVQTMRTIPIVGEPSIEWTRAYRDGADFLLLDSHEPGDRQIGGLNRTHDWRISRHIVEEIRIPAILAGGLDADNVAAAIAAVRPAGVDSKTKTDRADGVRQGSGKGSPVRQRREAHHVNAVARNSKAPLF